ncbi:MAG: ATP-dependent DNA ligase [Frankiales bacterium]|nr:ATP-dependent DNA ligase [Frankiales bacterium]
MNGGPVTTEVGGRQLRLTNLDKVLYPETGTTKAEVLQYYLTVAPAILALAKDRPVTRKRWPDGVGAEPFFEKNMPRGAPDWIPRLTLHHDGSRSGRGARDLDYPLLDEVAAVAWCAQQGALELHAPQWRVDRATGEPLAPDRVVVDLDPGAPAGLAECGEVALLVRAMLESHGMTAYAVTSGSKGMQVYAALAEASDKGRAVIDRAGSTSEYARALAAALEQHLPALVVSRMSKDLRPGKVFVDWSQNNPAKTTIVPWSLRGRDHPTAATPVPWADVEAGTTRQRSLAEALEWYADHAGDLAPLSP